MRIFYSWQSWTDRKTNQNFIQDAIGKAIVELKSDETLNVEPVLDRDTLGEAGSVAIADTIFRKIDESDVFICDVTSITTVKLGEAHNAVPNPNVLIELGYASSKLGWEKIICVFNEAQAQFDQLPFDLRHRRILKYRFARSDNEKSAKTSLTKDIIAALRAIFEKYPPAKKPDIVSLVKHLIPDPTSKIELEEILKSQIELVYEATSTPEFFDQRTSIDSLPTEKKIDGWHRILNFYFPYCEEALKVMVALTWHGNNSQARYIGEGIKRWMEQRETDPQPYMAGRYMPSLFLTYVTGIAAIERENWTYLGAVLAGNNVQILKQPYPPQQSIPALMAVAENCIYYYQDDEWKDINSRRIKNYPLGKKLQELLQPLLQVREYLPSPESYNSVFDTFELLLVLTKLHYDITSKESSWIIQQHGRVSFSNDRSLDYMLEFWKKGGRQGENWGLLKTGLFEANPTVLIETLKTYQDILKRADSHRDFMWGTPDYVGAYEKGLNQS